MRFADSCNHILLVEISLMYAEKRVANVTATDICDIYVLYKEDFDRILWDYPEMKRNMKRLVRDRLQSLVATHQG